MRITNAPSLKAPLTARSLRTVWRVAAMVAIIGGGTAAYLATTGGGPFPIPGPGPDAAAVAAAEEAVLDALDGLEADFSGHQLDSLMAEAAGLERMLESGLIDDDVLLEKGAM